MGVQPPQGPPEYSFKPLPSAFIIARAPTYLCMQLLDCPRWENEDGSNYLQNRLIINLTQGVGFFGGMVALPITVCLSPVTAAIDVIIGVTESVFYLCKGYTMVARTMAYNKIVVSPCQHLWFCLAIIKSFGLIFAVSSVFLLGFSCQVIPAFVSSAIFASVFWLGWYQMGIEAVIGLPRFINPNTFNILGRTEAIPEPPPRVATPPPEEPPRQATPLPQPEPDARSERSNVSRNQRAQANSSRRVPTRSEQLREEAERLWDNNFPHILKRSIYSFLPEYSGGVDQLWKSRLSQEIMREGPVFIVYYQRINRYEVSSALSANDEYLLHNFVFHSKLLMEQMRRKDFSVPFYTPIALLGLPKNFTYVDLKNRYLDLACILLNVEDESKRQAQVCLMNLLIYSVQVILSYRAYYEPWPRRGEDILKDWNQLVRRIINSCLEPLEQRNYFEDMTLEMFRNRARVLFRKEVSWLDQRASLFEKVAALRKLFQLPLLYTLNELRRKRVEFEEAFNREPSKEKQRVKFLLLDIYAYAEIVLTKYAKLRREDYDSSSSSDEEEKAPPPRQEEHASRQQALLPFEVKNKLIEWNNFFQSNLELAAALSLSQAGNNAAYQGFKSGVITLYNARRNGPEIIPFQDEFERIRNLFDLRQKYTQEELKKKVRKLQVVLHPDKNPDVQAEATFLWKVFQLTHPVLVENQRHLDALSAG